MILKSLNKLFKNHGEEEMEPTRKTNCNSFNSQRINKQWGFRQMLEFITCRETMYKTFLADGRQQQK